MAYDKNTDYQALIDAAVKKGDYAAAAKYEQQRNEKIADLNAVIREMAAQYGITDTGLAIAWILRLPEKMQPIVGSTNPERLRAIAKAADVTISAADWYKIYLAAGYRLP